MATLKERLERLQLLDELDQAVDAATALARAFEGCHRIGTDGLVYPYHDPVGFPTQGWGRLLSRERWADLSRWPPVTRQVADEWLEQDMQKALRVTLRLVRTEVTPQQAAALADFAFNAGAGSLQMSTLLRRVNEGEHEAAADQFKRWVYAGAVKLPGLVRRRAAERELYVNGATK